MSKERIYEILYENEIDPAYIYNKEFCNRVCKAMEQYGLETYQKGRADATIENRKIDLDCIESVEITRLRKLVQEKEKIIELLDNASQTLLPKIKKMNELIQAQKELIECLEDGRNCKNYQIAQLRNQIKELSK